MLDVFSKEIVREALTKLLSSYSEESFDEVIVEDIETDDWIRNYVEDMIDVFMDYVKNRKQMVYSVLGGHEDGTEASPLESEIFYEDAVLIYSEIDEAIYSNVDIENFKEIWLVGTGEVEVVTMIHIYVDEWDFVYRYAEQTIGESNRMVCALVDFLDYMDNVILKSVKDGDTGEDKEGR